MASPWIPTAALPCSLGPTTNPSVLDSPCPQGKGTVLIPKVKPISSPPCLLQAAGPVLCSEGRC